MKLYIEVPTKEKFEIEDAIQIFLNETIKLSSDLKIHVTGDFDTDIKNHGTSAEFKINTVGHHKLSVRQNLRTRHIRVLVKEEAEEVIVATQLNIKASKPITVSS